MTEAVLLNHLWQSTIFGAVAAVVALALRKHQARMRFWVWLAASLKFLVPFAAFTWLAGWMRALLPAPAVHAATVPVLVKASQPFTVASDVVVANYAGASGSHAVFYGLLVVWVAGMLTLAVRWVLRWRRVVRADASTLEPGVFGIFRQRIVLPPEIEKRLAPAELEAVLAHERCHMRRHDNFWSALHMVVETVFWFHPLVWIIGEQMVRERERACDEAVLEAGCGRAAYASAMLAVCRHYLQPPPELAAGISGGGLASRLWWTGTAAQCDACVCADGADLRLLRGV